MWTYITYLTFNKVTAVIMLYRKLCRWWVRNTQYLNPHTPLAKLCIWRLRWHRLEHLARRLNQVLSQMRQSGWDQWHKILEKETNISMGKGESEQVRTTREHTSPDYLTENVSIPKISQKTAATYHYHHEGSIVFLNQNFKNSSCLKPPVR